MWDITSSDVEGAVFGMGLFTRYPFTVLSFGIVTVTPPEDTLLSLQPQSKRHKSTTAKILLIIIIPKSSYFDLLSLPNGRQMITPITISPSQIRISLSHPMLDTAFANRVEETDAAI